MCMENKNSMPLVVKVILWLIAIWLFICIGLPLIAVIVCAVLAMFGVIE